MIHEHRSPTTAKIKSASIADVSYSQPSSSSVHALTIAMIERHAEPHIKAAKAMNYTKNL